MMPMDIRDQKMPQTEPSRETYRRILDVLRKVGRPMAAFEFAETTSIEFSKSQNARQYVGQTEATIARRLREMARLGYVVTSKRPSNRGVMLAQYSLPQQNMEA